MILVRALPTRPSKRGDYRVSWALFRCEACGREVARERSAGLKQASCGCLRHPVTDNAEGIRRALARMEAGGELPPERAALLRYVLGLLLSGDVQVDALAPVLCRFVHEAAAGNAWAWAFSLVRTRLGEETAEAPKLRVVR